MNEDECTCFEDGGWEICDNCIAQDEDLDEEYKTF